MRRTLPLLLVVLASAEAAHAGAAKPRCPLVKDAADDVVVLSQDEPELPVDEPRVDVTSVDFAADANRLTAVVRVASLAAAPDDAQAKLWWKVEFTIRGTHYDLAAEQAAGTVRYLLRTQASTHYGSVEVVGHPVLAEVTGTVDRTRNEVRITAPLSALGAGKLRKGTAVSEISAYASRMLLTNSDTTALDDPAVSAWALSPYDETTAASYALGAAACIRA